jgi:hypothetical protein
MNVRHFFAMIRYSRCFQWLSLDRQQFDRLGCFPDRDMRYQELDRIPQRVLQSTMRPKWQKTRKLMKTFLKQISGFVEFNWTFFVLILW